MLARGEECIEGVIHRLGVTYSTSSDHPIAVVGVQIAEAIDNANEANEAKEAKMEVEEENYMDLLKREEKRSVETLLEELKKRMMEADARRQAFYRETKKRRNVIIVSKEEKIDQVPVKEEEKSDEDDEAVIEVVNEFEEVKDEATIEDVTPQLFTNAVVPTKHVLLTINKNGLSPAAPRLPVHPPRHRHGREARILRHFARGERGGDGPHATGT